MNNTFKEIAEELKKAENVLVFPHVGIDGDGIGSAVAVCRALRIMGKNAYVLMEDDIPGNLQFMIKDYVTFDEDVIPSEKLDVSLCVDCGEYKRFPKHQEKFRSAKVKLCVDHHGTTVPICDLNYIDPGAAAAGELVYELLKELGFGPGLPYGTDKEIGEAIFAAITTDTGNFQYSNTTKQSHEIAAELYDWGIDSNYVSVEIYENQRPQRLQCMQVGLDHLQIIAGGLGAISCISKAELDEIGAEAGETEEIVQKLRAINGVEYAAFLKEKEENKVRVSLRAKRRGNVAAIATRLGGGGHTKAAGCTIEGTVEEAMEIIRREIEKEAEGLAKISVK